MIVSNLITGCINFLSFLSLSVTTSSESSFLGAVFILAASIFLEALSLQNDSKHIKSLVITIGMVVLYLISVSGFLFSVAGLAKFIKVYFLQKESIHIMVSSFPYSIYHFGPIDANSCFVYAGIAITLIPLCLTCREFIIQNFRKSHYNLDHGLCGK